MSKKYEVPTWEELTKRVKSTTSDGPSLFDYLTQTFPRTLWGPLALALSVCKWDPRNRIKDLGCDNCALCGAYNKGWNECSGDCPLNAIGENCYQGGSLYTFCSMVSSSYYQALKYKKIMYNLLVHLYAQAYEAYPNKPKYTLPKGFKK